MRILPARSCLQPGSSSQSCTAQQQAAHISTAQPAHSSAEGHLWHCWQLLTSSATSPGCNTTLRDPAVMMVSFLPNLPLNLKAVLQEKAAFHQHLGNTGKTKQDSPQQGSFAPKTDSLLILRLVLHNAPLCCGVER